MDADCGICWSPLFDHDDPDPRDGTRREKPLGMMQCGHVYHQFCVTRWHNQVPDRPGPSTPTCPHCREGILRPQKGAVVRLYWPGQGSPYPNPLDPVATVKGKARAVGERAADMGVETTAIELEKVLGPRRGLADVLLTINKLDAHHWDKASNDYELKARWYLAVQFQSERDGPETKLTVALALVPGPQTVLTSLSAVFDSLHSKLHYTQLNTSLRDNVVALEQQVASQKKALDDQARQHRQQLAACQASADARFERKENEWRTKYLEKVAEKTTAWQKREEEIKIEANAFKDKVAVLVSEKRKLYSDLAEAKDRDVDRLRSLDKLQNQNSALRAERTAHREIVQKLDTELVLARASQSRKRSRQDDGDQSDGSPVSDQSTQDGECDESLEVMDESFGPDVVFAQPARPRTVYRTSSNASKPLQPSTSHSSNRLFNSASVPPAPQAVSKSNPFASGPRNNIPVLGKRPRPAEPSPFGPTAGGKAPLLVSGEKRKRKAII